MSTPTESNLGIAIEAARAARDVAFADPLTERHALANEWAVLVARIAAAPTLAAKIADAERAETVMRRRVLNRCVEFRRPSAAPIDFAQRRRFDDTHAGHRR